VALTLGGTGRCGASIGRAARLGGGGAWSSLAARWKQGGEKLKS
jgi:hypothetical protein